MGNLTVIQKTLKTLGKTTFCLSSKFQKRNPPVLPPPRLLKDESGIGGVIWTAATNHTFHLMVGFPHALEFVFREQPTHAPLQVKRASKKETLAIFAARGPTGLIPRDVICGFLLLS